MHGLTSMYVASLYDNENSCKAHLVFTFSLFSYPVKEGIRYITVGNTHTAGASKLVRVATINADQ